MTASTLVVVHDEDENHDCLDHVICGLSGLQCGECGEPVDVADATCTWCGRYPCSCDEAYERARDERMGL